MSGTGYRGSAWPIEGGGNHRPKSASGPGLGLRPTDRLVATTRHTGRWPVMFVHREPGELYLHGTSSDAEAKVAGWVERVDPHSLEPLEASGDLRAGNHRWCGSIAVHQNGDIYTVDGSFVHRLDRRCAVLEERALPVDHPHNGLVILGDGSLVTVDVRGDRVPSTLTVCDPGLTVLASLQLPEPSIGRLAATGAGPGEHLYVAGATRIFRYRWDGSGLRWDQSWQPGYRVAGQGGPAWDLSVIDGRVWLMANGNINAVAHRFTPVPAPRSISGHRVAEPVAWSEPVRAVGISVADPGDLVQFAPTEAPSGWIAASPLVHDGVVVCWDTGNLGIAAFDVRSSRRGEMLWFQPFRTSMQPLCYPDAGELIVNDFRVLSDGRTSDDIVVIDLLTGQMKARVPTGATGLSCMFLCPGWDRDLYYCTPGTVARIRAESP